MATIKQVFIVFRTMHKDFRKGLKAVRSGLVSTQRQIDNMQKPLKRLGATMSRQKMGFQMWALGVMFFGMQVMRIFSRIAKSAFDSFNKIMGESITTAREAMMGLSASTEMLKFSIGSAIASSLEPFIPLLLNIIDSVSDWVEQNEELTTSLTLGGVALGAFMFFGGQMILFISSMSIFWFMWGAAIKAAIAAAVSALAPFAGWIALIIILVGLLYAAWENNWLGMRDIVDDLLKELKEIVGVWFDDIAQIFGLLGELVTSLFKGELEEIPGILEDLGDKITEFSFDIWVGLIKATEKVIESMEELFTNFQLWLVSFFINLVRDVIANWREILRELAKDIINIDMDVSPSMRGKIEEFVADFVPPSSVGGNVSNINITIEGNVIGEQSFLNKLGAVIQEHIRRQGIGTSIYG